MPRFFLLVFLSCCPVIWSQSTHSYRHNAQFCTLFIHEGVVSGYGVIDQNANWILQSQFDYIWINDNRIAARKSGKWALFNTKGKQLTEFKFDDIEMQDYGWGNNFMETMLDNWKHYGLIDTNGKEILPPIYSSVNASYGYDHHKCISYCIAEDSCGVLDSNLQSILEPIYSGSICIYPQFIEVFKDGKTGLFDYSGHQIGMDWYGTEMESIGFLQDEKFLPVELNGKYGILNVQTGKYLVRPAYEKIESNFVTPGAGFFYWENGLLGLMDISGKHITPAIYQDELVDYDSKTIGLMKDSLWGLVDLSGKLIIPFEYEGYLDYQEAVLNSSKIQIIEVRKNGLIGYFTDGGKLISKPQYKDRWGFQDEFARVTKDSLWGLINPKGEYVLPLEYEELGTISLSRMVAKKNGKYGLINVSGEIILPFEYDDIKFYSGDSLVAVKLGYKWGIIDHEGKWILPAEYPYLYPYDFNRIIIYNYFPTEGVWYNHPIYQGLADYKGNIIVPLNRYRQVSHIFPNGASVFYDGGKYFYIGPDGKEKMLE